MIVDFSTTNPTNWKYNTRPNKERKLNEAIVYELHVRDLTTSSTWNGSEENRGKFLGLVEENTTYTSGDVTVTTGFDHIKELGVTDVQLIPIFDHGVIDETRLNDPSYQQKVFNWGYMPENYNALEGSYSSNPYDGLSRIKEFKEAVLKFNQNEIGVIMDVVYNHTGKSADSNFDILVPGYYYRKNGNAFSNGSGCGNETASERAMMRKFMVDSCLFWAKEYNLSGFRFDLMALHDYETMNVIAEELRKVDPSIIVYGEPWNGGSTPLPQSKDAGKTNIKNMPYVGAFNDESRDAIKGSVFTANEGGWLQGTVQNNTVEKIKYGIVGGSSHSDVDFNGWHKTPINIVNYVSAHDNNTLWDKLTLTKINKIDARKKMQKQANAIVLTSQGLSFLHAGVEIARSKPLNSGFDHNSYESPDSVNQIDWSRKVNYIDVFDYYKALINLKKNHSAFNLSTVQEVQQKISFINTNNNNVIAYTIKDSNDIYKEFLIIHNGKGLNTINLDGKYQILGNHTGLFEESIGEASNRLVLMENTTYILYKGEKINVETTTQTTTQQTTTQTTIQQTTTTTTQQGKGGNCKKNNASLTDVLVSITSSIALVGACAYLYKRK
jgi:pullulanase